MLLRPLFFSLLCCLLAQPISAQKVYQVDSRYDADIKIYFSDSRYDAGWREKNKSHLMR